MANEDVSDNGNARPTIPPRDGFPEQVHATIADLTDVFKSCLHLSPTAQQVFNHYQTAVLAARAESHDEAVGSINSLSQLFINVMKTEISKAIHQEFSKAFKANLSEIFAKAVRENLRDQVVEAIGKEVGEIIALKVLAEDARQRDQNHKAIQELAAVVANLQGVQQRLLGNADAATLSQFAGHGTLLSRYRQNGGEKAELGRQTAAMFFRGPMRCFVLASSIAVHLAEQLRRGPIAPGSFFSTNSFAFPVVLLGPGVPHEVTTFCGPAIDAECGAWLPNVADGRTFDSLRGLFTPYSSGGWNLTTAFLCPYRLSVESGMYFQRSETARLAQELVTIAPHVVLLLTADRLCAQFTDQETTSTFPTDGNWSLLNKPVTLLVAGVRPQRDLLDLAQRFKQRGIQVHYQDPANAQWRMA
jgi:hypothetical protein